MLLGSENLVLRAQDLSVGFKDGIIESLISKTVELTFASGIVLRLK